jgi:6-phosphogluconate dehydrogenase
MSRVIIIMGVSGSGKSTVGKLLAKELDLQFFDADDFHPKTNVDKMSRGKPLTDEDRLPWLSELSGFINEWQDGEGAVLACSALKESYRTILAQSGADIDWVYLKGDFETINTRIKSREGHFMSSNMLQSQFGVLEEPTYGIQVNVDNEVSRIVSSILSQISPEMNKSDIGLIGLGVMGKSLSINIASHNYAQSVYNRIAPNEEHTVWEFLSENDKIDSLQGFTDLAAFVISLAKPSKIVLMISAGSAIDSIIEELLPLIDEGDIIIDGGNSFYIDTEKRQNNLIKEGIHFVGAGISGGEEGARNGPSIMPGGLAKSYEAYGNILEAIAAKDQDGLPCCAYIGPGGSGHFVKMVHNGIEYAEMQLLAELYAIMSKELSKDEIAAAFTQWNTTGLNSYLLEISSIIVNYKEGDEYLLDLIQDKADNKGTGSWSGKAAMILGIPATMIDSAVLARYISSFKNQRKKLSDNLMEEEDRTFSPLNLEVLAQAYEAARSINYHQGFALLDQASRQYDWNLNLSEIARIWTNGCILKSALMQQCVTYYKTQHQLIEVPEVFKQLNKSEEAMVELLQASMERRVAAPSFSSAYNYWLAITTDKLPANLIQAQRDYFGAHTYQRTDRPEGQYFHTVWQ